MTERPILFSGPMVRAILEGRKTMTRRVIKPQPTGAADVQYRVAAAVTMPVSGRQQVCPYGRVGDHLWVRETWAPHTWPPTGPSYQYAADDQYPAPERWRPSIHMPRAASRITLEVLNARVERLHDISEEDAKAEGVTLKGTSRYDGEARDAFEALWCGINGADSWEANHWVWVIGFKVIKP